MDKEQWGTQHNGITNQIAYVLSDHPPNYLQLCKESSLGLSTKIEHHSPAQNPIFCWYLGLRTPGGLWTLSTQSTQLLLPWYFVALITCHKQCERSAGSAIAEWKLSYIFFFFSHIFLFFIKLSNSNIRAEHCIFICSAWENKFHVLKYFHWLSKLLYLDLCLEVL